MLIAYTKPRLSKSASKSASKSESESALALALNKLPGYIVYIEILSFIIPARMIRYQELPPFNIPSIHSVSFGFPLHGFPAYNSRYRIAKFNGQDLVIDLQGFTTFWQDYNTDLQNGDVHDKTSLEISKRVYLHRRKRGKHGYKYFIVLECKHITSPERPSAWHRLRNAEDYDDEIHCLEIGRAHV